MNKFFTFALVVASSTLVAANLNLDALEVAKLGNETQLVKKYCITARKVMLTPVLGGETLVDNVLLALLNPTVTVKTESAEIAELFVDAIENSHDSSEMSQKLEATMTKISEVEKTSGETGLAQNICKRAAVLEDLATRYFEEFKRTNPKPGVFYLRDIRCRSTTLLTALHAIC